MAAHVLGIKAGTLPLYEGEADAAAAERAAFLLARRLKGEPLQYVLGETEFMSLPFRVRPGVLIPRGDTECLVEEAIRLFKDQRAPLLGEMGCGSGAIAVSLGHYLPQAKIWATDISPQALEIARENACLNGVEERITFLEGDLLNPLQGLKLDLLISNPPYIPRGELSLLARELSHEPLLALEGGADGLDFYRRLAKESPAHLKKGGRLLLEIGWQQKEAVCALLKTEGFVMERILWDLGGRERGILARRA